ncbi:MAG: TIGR01777 family oxidoreductase [Bdellovibrionota bacterium]
MRILVSGGTGFIGRHLCLELLKNGHDLTLVTRDKKKTRENWQLPTEFVEWDMEHKTAPSALDANSFDAVVHLAGESIAGGRWTKKRKQRILDSRTKTTANLGDWLSRRHEIIPVVISASAVGYYSDKGEAILDESSPKGQGFLADVCEAWENSVKALPAKREARLRFGVVIGQGGGFLKPLRLLTNYGLGEVIGSGKQKMSFVHRSDIIEVIGLALSDSRYAGPINLVAPQIVTQAEFQKTLSRLMHRPTLLRVPGALPKLAIGDMATLVLGSQHVVPRQLTKFGYTFLYPTLESALSEALDLREKNGKLLPCHRLENWQFVARPIEQIYPFFSAPENLEQITPPMLSFKIESITGKPVGEGTIINYKLKVHGLPMRWKTRITDWDMPTRFADNQEKGPYAIWYHTHSFYSVKGGTLMTDLVRYRLPLGFVGDTVALPLVKRDVNGIFSYRRLVIDKEFPPLYHSPHASS